MESQIHKVHQQLVNKEITCTELVQQRLDLLKTNTHNTVNSLLDTLALELAKKVDDKILNGFYSDLTNLKKMAANIRYVHIVHN